MIGVVAVRVQPELDTPRGTAAKELAALVNRRASLDEREGELDQQQRAATAEVELMRARLADLERAAVSGDKVDEKTRREAEEALTRARLKAAEPWAERREGVRAAMREADQAVTTFVGAHFDELLAELREDAENAAEDLNRACARVVDAYAERARVEQCVTSLCAIIRHPRPGDIAYTRAAAVAKEAETLLLEGGEAAPLPRVDPRQPRHAEAVAELDPDAEIEPVA
jgi:hypothetical protein